MIRRTTLAAGVPTLIAVSLFPAAARAQADNGAQAVVNALRANPLLLPYDIQVTPSKGAIVLSGKVGTKQIHDMVVRTVIDLGLVPRDDLVIDTGEAHRVALNQSYNGPQAGLSASAGTAPYFVYPPPLFGRLDDPFWGFEPPILSFPPGYTRPAEPGVAPAGGPVGQAKRASADPIKGQVQLIIDAAGQVFLSGVVATEKDKREIEQEVQSALGGAPLSSDLKVADQSEPPPPPEPMIGSPIRERRKAPERQPVAAPEASKEAKKPDPTRLVSAADALDLTRRAVRALEKRASLKESRITVRSSDEVVTISGTVPSAYEAMLAYRAVEQTPGVHDVVDKLEFPLPDENHPNPLKDKGRPDDLEAYLTYQIRRHAGEIAHIDRVRVHGDVVEVRGTLEAGEDPDRIAATLRSIPVLRGFRIDPSFSTD